MLGILGGLVGIVWYVGGVVVVVSFLIVILNGIVKRVF